MRHLISIVARTPLVATAALSALLMVAPVAAQDLPQKPKKEAPKQKAPPKKAPPKKASAKKAAPPKKAAPKKAAPSKPTPSKPAPSKPAPKKAAPKKPAPEALAPVEGRSPFAREFATPPPEMLPPELEEPEMVGAPEAIEAQPHEAQPHEAQPHEVGKPRFSLEKQAIPKAWRKARLGVVVEPVEGKQLADLGVPATGILVKELIKGAPAQREGMLPGDVIVGVDNHDIAEARDAWKALFGKQPGDIVAVKIIRNKKPMTLRLKLDQGTSVIRPHEFRIQRRRQLNRRRFKMKMRQWRRDLRRRHRLRMRQLYRRRY